MKFFKGNNDKGKEIPTFPTGDGGVEAIKDSFESIHPGVCPLDFPSLLIHLFIIEPILLGFPSFSWIGTNIGNDSVGDECASEVLPVKACIKVAEKAVHGDIGIKQLAGNLIDPLVYLVEVGMIPGLEFGHGEGNALITCNECAQRGNHRLAGCVTVATAQAIATMGKFNGTFYGNRDIDFTQLPAYGFFMNDAQAQTVAQFFHEVAICCQAEFGCNGSGSTIKAAYQYLKDLGYNCTYEEKEINVAKLKDELSKGIPHLIAGRSFEAGHMWIVDGLKITGGKTYFNCNWGWGGASDGWADSYPFIPNGETDIKNIFSQNIRNIYIYSKL